MPTEGTTPDMRKAAEELSAAMDDLLLGLAAEFGTECFCEIDGQGNHAPLCPRRKAWETLNKFGVNR